MDRILVDIGWPMLVPLLKQADERNQKNANAISILSKCKELNLLQVENVGILRYSLKHWRRDGVPNKPRIL